MNARRRNALVVVLVLSLCTFDVHASAATTRGHSGDDEQTSASCDIYPIAVASSRLRGVGAGTAIEDLTVDAPPGNKGWLTWTGDLEPRTLAKSLTPPGDSETFVNPDEVSDRVLSVGDWVRGRPGTVASSDVRRAIDELVGKTIVLPVWDVTRGSGSGVAYHFESFASVKITSFSLSPGTKVTAVYLGPSSCAAPNDAPAAMPTSATTSEDTPRTITLTGTDEHSSSDLGFQLTPPAHGAATLNGPPVCTRDARDAVTCTASVTYSPAPAFFGADEFFFTVSDGLSASIPAQVTITVEAVNDPPVAGADSANATHEPLAIDADTLLANDTPGPANETNQSLTLTAVAPGTHGSVTLDDDTVTFVAEPGYIGTATFTYTVCDNGTTAGQSDSRCADGLVTITVAPAPNEPPVANAATVEAVEDASKPITLSGNDTDGDPLQFTITSAPSHGTLSGAAPNLTYTPAPDYFGPDEFSFTVFDGQAASAPAVVSITVSEVNDPPIAGADSASRPAGQPTTIAAALLLANDVAGPPNEAGQNLAVTEVAAGADTHGTVTLDAGTITYTPDAGFTGSASFAYTICDDGTTDGDGDPLCTTTGTVTIEVGAPNEPPVADPATVEAVEDTPIPITLTGSDPDGDPVLFVVATPGNGTLTGNAPNLMYTPRADFFGPDTFTFTVTDGQAVSVPAMVSINVGEVNDEPVAGADSASAPGHQPSEISAASLLVNDLPRPSNEATQTLDVTAAIAGPDTHGTVSFDAGTITYIPDPVFVGPASFTYTVCDNGTTAGAPDPLCADGLVSLSVAPAPNEPPVGEPASVEAVEDMVLPIVLAGSDPDLDPLVFAIASAPSHGSLSGIAPALTYTPAPDYFGPDSFTFTVFDQQATSVPVAISITVTEVNDPPFLGPDAATVTGGQSSTLDAASLLANDVAGPPNEANQHLAVTEVAAGPETHGTVTLAGETITYTPDPGFAGRASFTYSVCDDGTTDGLADPRCTSGGTVTFEVVDPNEPPVANAQSVTVAEDHALPVTLSGSDPDGDPLTFAVAGTPAHGTLSGNAPALTYTPEGDYNGSDSFVFTANDGATNSAPATVTINVTEVNDPPLPGTDAFTLGGAGTLPPPTPPSCGEPCGVIYADPHLITFDRTYYDVQAVGEFIAAKSTTDDFEVQARFAAVPGMRNVSIDTAVALRVAGHRVTMYRTPTGMITRVDGAEITPAAQPQPLPGGGTIGTYGLSNAVIVVWPDESVVIVRAVGIYPEFYRFTVELGLAPSRLGNMVGLLGNANDDPFDDLVTRGGQPVTFPNTPFAELYGVYANSWRISNAESLFDYAPGESTETFTDLTFPDAPATPQSLPPAARASATTTCNLFGLTTQEALDACIVDVGITGDADFATTAADAQEAALGIPSNAGATDIGAEATVVTTVAGENAVRTFPATAGQRLVMRISGNTYAEADVTIRNPNGTTVLSLFVNTPTAFRDVFTLAADGTYTITVDPRAAHTGTLTFLLSPVADNTGTTAIGTPTTITTTTIGENAERTFTATAGQKLTLHVSGNSFVPDGVDLMVQTATGGFVASLFVNTATAFRDVFTLATTGTYRVVVDPRLQQTGTVTFLLSPVADNTGTTAIGTPTTITTTTIGENAERTFTATAGQKLTLHVSGNSFVPDGVDLMVQTATGGFVASLFVNTATAFRDVFTLATTGTYRVVVDPRLQQTGTVTFLLSPVADNTGTTAIGTPTTITTTTIGENAERTFTATAGQKLTLHVSGNSFVPDGVDLMVQTATGGFVASLFVNTATAFRDVFTLATTGTYRVVVDPRLQQTGTVTFLLSPVADNTGTTAIGTPTTITTTTIGENAERTFTATAGQKLTLHVSGNSFVPDGVDLMVQTATGGFVASLFVNTATAFRDVFTLATTGTYRVVVDPRLQQTGTVTFLLSPVADNTGTTAIGTPTTITTTTIGENAERTFTGTAGQQLTVAVSGNTFLSGGVDLTVLGPGNVFVASLFVNTATGFRDAFTLPTTGTYRVVVDPRLQQTGSLAFLLAVAPGALSSGALGLADDPSESVLARLAASDEALVAEDTAATAASVAAFPTLTFTVDELLANDRPGPANESGQTLTVTEVTAGSNTHGTVTFAAGVVTYTADADFVGNAVIPYTVCDNGTTNGTPDPLCSAGAINVKVTVNQPPVVVPQTVTTTEDTSVPLTLTGSDPDGEPIAFVVVAAPRRGTLTGTPPALTYVPAPDANGVDTFTFTANDGNDQSQPATVTVNVSAVNDPPVPQPNTVTARAGESVNVPAATLTSNDDAGPVDERFQTLTVTAVTAGPDTHGTVSLAAGTVTYVPAAGFTGTAVVDYTVCDDGTTGGAADPLCAGSTLSIAANRAPVGNGQSVQTSLTKPVALTLTGTDPDGDTLTFAVASQPDNGTLSGTAPNVTYTAASGFVGTDSFTFTVADAFGASAPATVSITVNDIPSPTLGLDSASVRAGFSVLIDVLGNDAPGSGTIDASTLSITGAPAKGATAIESGQVRYTANAGTSGPDSFSYTVCDTGGGCATAVVSILITENTTPVANDDEYDINDNSTLRPAVPGVLGNDTDPDAGDRLQARLVRGVTNGNLLLYSTGTFTYVPHGPGIDSFVYHVVDASGAVSNDATVTIVVTGPAGPPIIGNDLFEVEQGRELVVTAPGVLTNDTSPNPRLGLTVQLARDAAKGTLLLQPDGSFVYTPIPGYSGIDQFSYTVRDSEGRVSAEARVGITVKTGGPPTATVGTISPPAGTILLGPTHFTATLAPPPGETVTGWTVSYRRPGDPVVAPLASGAGNAVAADFDPTLVRNGTYAIVIRAVTSGGGVLVNETGVSVEGDYKPGRYMTTYRDVALNSSNIPIEVFRTYDSTNKSTGDFGAGWNLELANFRVESNGPLGGAGWSKLTCGSFPFLATCYQSSKPHFVTVTWPDGHLERFRFAPNQGSQLVPNITTAGFVAEPGTTSTLTPFGDGLLLVGSDFLLGDFFSSDGIYDPLQFVLTDKYGTKFTLDRRAGLLGIVDRNGNAVSFGSDGVDSSSGMSLTFVRDPEGRITRIVSPTGNVDYTYDAAGDLVRVDYPDGTHQTLTYEGDHNLLTVSGGGQLLRTVHYNDDGRVTAVTDGNGNTATIDSDVAGHQQVLTDATGELTTVNTYDERGNIVRQDDTFDGRTITTRATFDDHGRELSATDGNGNTSFTTYDDDGNVLTQTDGNGHTTRFTYSEFAEVLTVTDPTSRVTTYAYDARGNLVEEVAPGGATTTNTYDDRGLLLTKTDSAGTTTYVYDAAGNPQRVTDPEGNTLSQVVDADTGWILSSTNGEFATTKFHYDAVGRVAAVENDAGERFEFTYDQFGQVTRYTDQLGDSTVLDYDDAGNIVSIRDRDGAISTYGYDAIDRLTSKSVSGTGAATYDYDPLGRLLVASNDAATLTFTYDDAGDTLAATSTLLPATFAYTYDAANNVLSTAGPGGATSYGYDDANRLTSVVAPGGGTYAMAYDARGLLAVLNRPNGMSEARSYNDFGALASIESRLGAAAVGEFEYAYDGAKRRTSATTVEGTTSFGYDRSSQLISADYPAASGIVDQLFGYDSLGNRISTNEAPGGSFTHDAANRLLADQTHDYVYDAEGRLRSRTVRATGATTSYQWSGEHELIGISYPDGSTTTLRYDPLGRRVEIDDAGSVTRYAFDGDAIAGIYDGADSLIASFTHDPADPTRTLEMQRGTERFYFHVDALGSTAALTDSDGEIAGTYRYDAWGNAIHSGTVTSPFTFTGQLVHERSGLMLFPARAYDPQLGRFVSEDPLFAVNAYRYADCNPTNMVDPLGLAALSEDVTIRCKSTWNALQVQDAVRKAGALEKASKAGLLVRSLGRADKAVRKAAEAGQAAFRKSAGLKKFQDADHIVELVLGGAVDALWPLDSSVNRSFGSQIGKAVKDIPIGTKITISYVNC